MSGEVTAARIGDVAVLTLDAPHRRNALSTAMLTRLHAALTAVDDVDAVVLTGGDTCFSAGANLRELTGTAADTAYDDTVARVADAIDACPAPVLAALEGPCVGAAAHLALACDVRIAGRGAFIQVPAVRLGLLYSPIAVESLARRYREDTVRRLLLLAERFDADAAHDAGLVSRIVDAGGATAAAVESVAGLSVRSRAAVSATRALLGHLESGGVADEHWQERRLALLDSPDRAAAIADAHRRHGATPSRTTSPTPD